ncbi:AraC family transcriptional regulator [Mucilaginibacter sp. OK283]|uniref:helix-turn-helix domain-containing protein n=1 Tax=Mucilaginibacter sp. OK283 TaxID=1881049 RepID=UPI0015A50759|nr:AraC family transcriptional regulator [Mucilaginibacter sp. OK283]
MVDDDLIEMHDRSVYFILPGQLRYHVDSQTESWILAVNASFLQEGLRLKLNEHYYGKKPVPLSQKKAERFTQCMRFLAEDLQHPLYKFSGLAVRKGLIDVISGMITEEYAVGTSDRQGEHSRFAAITREFKELLLNNFKKMKKPAEYADALSLSTPYLNQVIKASTGFNVSFWIQKMIMNEARVLLSASLKPIKEIAHELGYTDQAYFSRLFSRTQKISPQGYRLIKQAQLPWTGKKNKKTLFSG